MALGMASLITNQSRVPYELVQSLVPNTFQGNVAKWSEWMMNHPESAEAQAFVKRMVQTVQREQQTASQQIAAIQQQQAQRFNHLAVARPDRYRAHLSAGQSYLNMPTLDQVATGPGATNQAAGAIKVLKDGSKVQKAADGKWYRVK